MKVKILLTMSLIVGALALVACGGNASSDDSGQNSSVTASQEPTGAGPPALSAEEIQCLEDQGVTVPETPEGSPEGNSGDVPGEMPEGGPPPGAGDDLEEMQAAMSECGIEMPDPPAGAPSGEAPSDQGFTPSGEA